MSASVRQAVEISLSTRLPTILWGAPGVGKTAWSHAFHKAINRELFVCIASQKESVDFGGYPLVINGEARLVPLGAMVPFVRKHDGNVTILLDEYSCTPPSTQAAALTFIQTGMLGETQIDENCSHKISFMLCANPAEMAANGYNLMPPSANRLIHFDWNPSPEVFVKGMIEGWHTVSNAHVILPKDWESFQSTARTVIGSYIGVNPNALHVFPKKESEQGRAWPSWRSWENLSTLYAAAESVEAGKDVKFQLACAAVGEPAAIKFFAWYDALDLPDAEESLKNPDKFQMPKRGDQRFVALNNITAAVIRNPTPQRWHAGIKIFARVIDLGMGDYAAAGAGPLFRAQPPGIKAVPELLKFRPILISVGIMQERG